MKNTSSPQHKSQIFFETNYKQYLQKKQRCKKNLKIRKRETNVHTQINIILRPSLIRCLILIQSKTLPKSQHHAETCLMVNKKMRKLRERNKKCIMSELCRMEYVKGGLLSTVQM